jgi:hypothetical protein
MFQRRVTRFFVSVYFIQQLLLALIDKPRMDFVFVDKCVVVFCS